SRARSQVIAQAPRARASVGTVVERVLDAVDAALDALHHADHDLRLAVEGHVDEAGLVAGVRALDARTRPYRLLDRRAGRAAVRVVDVEHAFVGLGDHLDRRDAGRAGRGVGVAAVGHAHAAVAAAGHDQRRVVGRAGVDHVVVGVER